MSNNNGHSPLDRHGIEHDEVMVESPTGHLLFSYLGSNETTGDHFVTVNLKDPNGDAAAIIRDIDLKLLSENLFKLAQKCKRLKAE